MREASWGDCLDCNSAMNITPDKEKARSLVETAEERIRFSIQEVDEKNANYVFESYYASILEFLHAVVLLAGYKVSNHLCLGYYLRDVLKREELFRAFDDCRFKRNALVYYGKRMEFEMAKETTEKARELVRKLRTMVPGGYL